MEYCSEDTFRAAELIPGLQAVTLQSRILREEPMYPVLIMGRSELLQMVTQLQQILRGNTYPGGMNLKL